MIESIKNTSYEAKLYDVCSGNPTRYDRYQRPFGWGKEQVLDVIDETFKLASFTAEKREAVKSNLLNICVYTENGITYIADGHSRMMVFNLLVIAINDYITKNNLTIPMLSNFNMNYIRENSKETYAEFVQNHTCSSKYGEAYKLIFKKIEDFLKIRRNTMEALIDVVKNRTVVTVKTCDNNFQAYKYFEQINTGGKSLSKNEVITSFIEYFTKEYGMEITYKEKELEDTITSYYYLNHNAPAIFNPYTLRTIMEEDVVTNETSFIKFQEYMDQIDAFYNTSWYTILNNLQSGKTMRIAYCLAGKGFKLDGTNEEVNKLLTGLTAFSIISSARGSNGGGNTSKIFTDLMIAIGSGKNPAEVLELLEKWIMGKNTKTKNTIRLNDFAESLDTLTDKKNAILYLSYWYYNQGAHLATEKYQVEHSFPEKPSKEWKVNGWPTDKDGMAEMYNCIGNQLLLDENANKDADNAYITCKDVVYTEFFDRHVGLKNTCNFFDAKRFEKEGMAYLIERRMNYAKFIASLPLGNIMVI